MTKNLNDRISRLEAEINQQGRVPYYIGSGNQMIKADDPDELGLKLIERIPEKNYAGIITLTSTNMDIDPDAESFPTPPDPNKPFWRLNDGFIEIFEKSLNEGDPQNEEN